MSNGGWRTVRVGAVARVIGGATPSTADKSLWGGDIPWLTPKDLSDRPARYTSVGSRSLTEEGLDSCSAVLVPKGTVLLTSRAPIGYVSIAGQALATNQGFKSLALNADQDPLFWYYLLRDSTEYLESRANGSTFKEISGSVVKDLQFRVPPLAEQRRIAGVLGALDDLIEVNRDLAQHCEQLAQSLVSSASMTTPLSDFITWGGLSTVKPVGLVDHYSLPAFDDGRKPERVDGSLIKSNKQQITQPCVLVARLNPHIPRVWMAYPDASVSSLASTEFVPICADGVPTEVVYAVCSAPNFLDQMNGLVTGTTGSHQRVDKDALTSVDVPDVRTLSTETLEAIALLVQQAHASRLEIRDLANTRDELLPLLMSGRIRVSEEVAA